MIFRSSQKLNAKIKAGPFGALPLGENAFADWSAHLFTADRTQYIILSNTKSLYSTLLYGAGITYDGRFINRALDSIREFMEGDGQAFAYHRFIVPSCGTVRFAKALNRSVTSSINDLIFHATVWLTEGEMSPYDVGFKLNDIPFSSLAGPGGGYGNPRETFKALLAYSANASE
jgi:hypothetical protein